MTIGKYRSIIKYEWFIEGEGNVWAAYKHGVRMCANRLDLICEMIELLYQENKRLGNRLVILPLE